MREERDAIASMRTGATIDLGRARKVITFGVVSAGFLTLILTGSLSIVEIALILVSIPAAWFWGERIAAIPRADTAATAAIILIFFLAVIGFFFFDRSFVAVTTGFLITVQAVRLLFLTEMRHYLQVYLISLFSVLAATVLTFSPIFIVTFIVYLCLATAGMIILTMSGEIQRRQGDRRPHRTLVFPPYLADGRFRRIYRRNVRYYLHPLPASFGGFSPLLDRAAGTGPRIL